MLTNREQFLSFNIIFSYAFYLFNFIIFAVVKPQSFMSSVDEYITQFPVSVQAILIKIRQLVFELDKEVEDRFSYGMPAYKLNKKPLIYFAAFKSHIGLYATPSGHEHFKERLSAYKQGKGSVQFSLEEDIPFDLIREIIQFRINENKRNS